VIEASGAAPRTEPFEEQTSTMIVFPQGGVLRLATVVNNGQMLVITNVKSRQEAICRVVKVRTHSNMLGYIEVEFMNRQPGYWGVYFPAEGREPAKKPSAPSAPTALEPQAPVRDIVAPEISRTPAPVASASPAVPPSLPAEPHVPAQPPNGIGTTRPAATPKTESHFVSIGSQEQVQPPAAETVPSKAVPTIEPKKDSNVIPYPKRRAEIDFPAAPVAPPPAPKPSVSSIELDEEEVAAVARPSREHPAAAESFGTRLDAETKPQTSRKEAPRQNWLLIAASVVVVLTGATGGFLYFRHRPAAHAAAIAAPVAAAQPAAATVAANLPPSVPGKPGHPGSSVTSATRTNANQSAAANAAGTPPAEAAPAKHAPTGVSSDLFGAMNAHPVAEQHAAAPQAEATAPSLSAAPAAASDTNALMAITSPANTAPAAPVARPSGPVRAGGQVRAPKLLSSTMPVYPVIARQMHTEGDVVINTVVDASGKVVSMKIVSGPSALRQAALDALRQWKYEPSVLDGQPVSVEMLVSIRFRL